MFGNEFLTLIPCIDLCCYSSIFAVICIIWWSLVCCRRYICYLFILSLQQRRCWYWNKTYSYLEIIFPNICCRNILDIEVIYYLSQKCKDLDNDALTFSHHSLMQQWIRKHEPRLLEWENELSLHSTQINSDGKGILHLFRLDKTIWR